MTENKTPYEAKDWQAITDRLIQILQNGRPGPKLLKYVAEECLNELGNVYDIQIASVDVTAYSDDHPVKRYAINAYKTEKILWPRQP